jgi:hypothetical protein
MHLSDASDKIRRRDNSVLALQRAKDILSRITEGSMEAEGGDQEGSDPSKDELSRAVAAFQFSPVLFGALHNCLGFLDVGDSTLFKGSQPWLDAAVKECSRGFLSSIAKVDAPSLAPAEDSGEGNPIEPTATASQHEDAVTIKTENEHHDEGPIDSTPTTNALPPSSSSPSSSSNSSSSSSSLGDIDIDRDMNRDRDGDGDTADIDIDTEMNTSSKAESKAELEAAAVEKE